jgi:RNA recognition motif-containing protein
MVNKEGETLFIGGFPPATKQSELRDYFSSYASLVSISIVKNQNDESRGFGYVTFSDPADIKAVIKGVHKIRGKMVSSAHFIEYNLLKQTNRWSVCLFKGIFETNIFMEDSID